MDWGFFMHGIEKSRGSQLESRKKSRQIKGSASLIWLQELRGSLLSITRFKQAVIGASY